MKKSSILFLFLFSLTIFAQSGGQIIHYSQNNTGYPISPSDFTLDNSNNLYISHTYRSNLDSGGITYFDGIHWKLTKKGDKDFPFANVWKTYYSDYSNKLYLYGSSLYSDDVGQHYSIATFDNNQNRWVEYGGTTLLDGQHYNGVSEFLETPTGELFTFQTNGFYRVEADTAYQLYPPDNPWFAPSKAVLKPDGGMYLLRCWADGWGTAYTGIYSFYGTEPDTIKEPLDSLSSAIDMVIDDHGSLWLLGNPSNGENFLLRFNNGVERRFFINSENSVNRCMIPDGDYIWIGTNAGDLLKFNTQTYELSHFVIPNPATPGTGNYNSDIKKMILRGDFIYILFNSAGLVKVNKNTGTVVDYWATSNSGICAKNESSITQMITDYRNHYWFNSLNNGVAMFNGDSWKTFSTEEISHRLVTTSWAIATDNNGYVYTVGDSLRYWSQTTGWKSLKPSNSIAPYFYGVSVVVDAEGMVWIADEYDGLIKFNRQTEEFTLYSSGQIGGERPTKVFLDKNNNLWIGFENSAPTMYDGNTFHHFNFSDGIEGTNVSDIAQAPDGTIWYSFYNNGLSKYSDGVWTSYTQANADVPVEQIRAMAVGNDGKVWIGSNNTSDTLAIYGFDGNSWSKVVVDSSLMTDVLDIMVDANNNIFVSAGYHDVFVYNSNQIVLGLNEFINQQAENFTLYQNYPNPFNPSTVITYSIPENNKALQNVVLTVYDILGRKITTLVNKKLASGDYSVHFNSYSVHGGLPSGIYFYTLQVGNFSQTKKMVLMK